MDNPEKLVTLDTQDEGGNQEWTIQRNLSKVTNFSGLSILDCHLRLVSCVSKVTSFSGLSIRDCHLCLVYDTQDTGGNHEWTIQRNL
jgi:hypothetical protein